MTIFTEILSAYKHIPYTFKHWIAYLKTEKRLLGDYRYKLHDWDKLIMYALFPFLGTKRIHNIHRRINKHHPIYKLADGTVVTKHPKDIDFYAAVIDWECASITKPDKPLNARQTMEKYFPQYRQFLEPVLQSLGL